MNQNRKSSTMSNWEVENHDKLCQILLQQTDALLILQQVNFTFKNVWSPFVQSLFFLRVENLFSNIFFLTKSQKDHIKRPYLTFYLKSTYIQPCSKLYIRLLHNRVGLRLKHVYHIYIMHYLYTYKQFKVGLIKIQHS